MGGVLFLSGMLIMAYNMFKTMAGGKTADAPVLAARRSPRLIQGVKQNETYARQDRT
jgi:cbb3-type cytochrome oxidase subunit 1